MTRRIAQPPNRVHAILFVCNVILQVDGLLFTILTNDIMMSFGVAIMIIGIGCFYASVPWMVTTMGLLVASTLTLLLYIDIDFSSIRYHNYLASLCEVIARYALEVRY